MELPAGWPLSKSDIGRFAWFITPSDGRICSTFLSNNGPTEPFSIRLALWGAHNLTEWAAEIILHFYFYFSSAEKQDRVVNSSGLEKFTH